MKDYLAFVIIFSVLFYAIPVSIYCFGVWDISEKQLNPMYWNGFIRVIFAGFYIYFLVAVALISFFYEARNPIK